MKKAQLHCPMCGHNQIVNIFTNRCLPFYQCDGCRKVIPAKKGNCCVICNYSDQKCPVSTKS